MVPQNCSLYRNFCGFLMKEGKKSMQVILIAGKSGSGKSTLGRTIVNLLKNKGIHALQTEFSKYIKLYAKEMLGVQEDDEKPRKFLQDMGVYIRDVVFDENFFIKRMLDDLKIYEKYFDTIVISDVRLKNEIEKMQASGYKVITIYVESTKDNDLTTEEKNHVTELELENYPNFDYRIKLETQEERMKFAKKIVEGEK